LPEVRKLPTFQPWCNLQFSFSSILSSEENAKNEKFKSLR